MIKAHGINDTRLPPLSLAAAAAAILANCIMQMQEDCFNLFEFFSLDDIFQPIRNASRIKYTCFDVSRSFLVLGATSGSLYLFLRDTLQYLKVIPNKEGSVNFICISPNEIYVAFSTTKGTIVVLEHNSDDGSRVRNGGAWTSGGPSAIPPRLLQIPQDHQSAVVTALQWNSSGNRLFVANDKGTVTAVNVTTKKTQALFQVQSSATIVRLSSRIVQLDFFNDKLLISTLTGCYICDTAKEQYSQIGSKPRDGEFGACFFTNGSSQSQILYAARPGSRLWEVDFEGSVLCTHQFKNALSKPPEPYVSIDEPFVATNLAKGSPQSLNFPKLLVLGDCFLLTWVKEKLYIFNMSTMEVLLWTLLPDEILDVKVCAKEVYIRHSDGRLRCFRLLQVERGLTRLLVDSHWELGASVCVFYSTYILAAKARLWVTKSMLQELEINLRKNGRDDLARQISELLPRVEAHPGLECISKKESFCNYRLSSGIYVVNKPNSNLRNGQLVSKNVFRNGVEGRLSSRYESKGFARNGSDVTTFDSNHVKSEVSVNGTTVAQQHKNIESTETNHASPHDVPLYMAYLNTASWDADPSYGYMALSSLKQNVSLGEIKNSLSSTYKSGKKRILNTMGILEDRLKLIGTEGYVEPFDDQLDVGESHLDEVSDALHHREESIVFPKKTSDRQYFEEMAFTKQHYAPNFDVNVEPLLKATQDIWERVQNPVVFCNVAQLKEILNEWVDILHSTQEAWYRELAKSSSEPRNKECLCVTAQLKHSKSCSMLSQHADISIELQRQSCPSLCDTLTSNCSDEEISNKLETTFYSESESDFGVQIETDEQKQVPGCCRCDSNSVRAIFMLEDVLWWQDMRLLRKDSKMKKNVMSAKNCWLCNPKFIVGNPWQLDFNKQIIQKLVNMCWKTKSFGRVMKYCQYFANWTKFETLDDDQSPVIDNTNRLLGLTKVELISDHARSIFVRQYFGLLKPEEVFQDVQLEKEWSCRTFESILNGLLFTTNCQSSNLARGLCSDKQPTNSFLSILRSETKDVSLLLEKMSDVPNSLSCRDVLYIDQILDCHSSLFLAYMDDAYGSTQLSNESQQLQKKCTLEHIRKDTTVQLIWLQLMLDNSSVPKEISFYCSICGKPKPFSHLYPWKWKERILLVIRKVTENLQLFSKLCEEKCFWIGLIYLHHLVGSRNEMFHLMVQLGDITLFEDENNIHLLPQSTLEWQFLFELVIKHEIHGQDFCVECKMNPYIDSNTTQEQQLQKQLTLEGLSDLALRYCDINVTVPLFEQLVKSHPMIRFSSEFYRKCITKSLIRQQQRVAVYNILEKTDAYVWSRRKSYASPEIRSLLLFKDATDVEVRKCRFLEDLHCHWGVSFDLKSSCSICSCPLVLLPSLTSNGIRVFSCGHGYHKNCFVETDMNCPTCSREMEQ